MGSTPLNKSKCSTGFLKNQNADVYQFVTGKMEMRQNPLCERSMAAPLVCIKMLIFVSTIFK